MYSAITANKRRTVLMMVLFVAFVGALGWLLSSVYGDGRPSVTVGVLVGALVYAIFSYYAASKMALALNGARAVQKRDNPRLYRIVENLVITEGLPMPKVYIIDDPALNAFATGRNPSKATICVTSGLLEALEDSELEGVVAHELGHIKNYDIRVSLMAFALVVAIGLLADFMLRLSWFGSDDDNRGNQVLFVLSIVAAVLAPLVATLIQLAISRQREYLADATGALATRYPEGLASALAKIQASGSSLKRQNTSTAHLFFANPLKGKGFSTLFSTHPPIEERIRRLSEISTKA